MKGALDDMRISRQYGSVNLMEPDPLHYYVMQRLPCDMNVLTITLLLLAFLSCSDGTSESLEEKNRLARQKDEAKIRAELAIPDFAVLSEMTGGEYTPRSMFGREGLRLVGGFERSKDKIDELKTVLTSKGWHALPLPSVISNFKMPPIAVLHPKSGLPNVQDGMFYCNVVYTARSGSKPRRLPCEEVTDRKFDHYRIGVFDSSTGAISFVAQNYY